jgi:hypothetical protein
MMRQASSMPPGNFTPSSFSHQEMLKQMHMAAADAGARAEMQVQEVQAALAQFEEANSERQNLEAAMIAFAKQTNQQTVQTQHAQYPQASLSPQGQFEQQVCAVLDQLQMIESGYAKPTEAKQEWQGNFQPQQMQAMARTEKPEFGDPVALPVGLSLRLAAAGIDITLPDAPKMKTKQGRANGAASIETKSVRFIGEPSPPTSAQDAAATKAAQTQKTQDTLRGFLSDLRNKDPKRVFVTRQIKDLGFRSKALLKQHFAKYGKVMDVLVAHTKAKAREADRGAPRGFRPGNFGLVVMESPEVVQRIFAEGSEQTINGVQIQVQVFELPATHLKAVDADSPDEGWGASDSRSGSCSDDQPNSSSSGNCQSSGNGLTTDSGNGQPDQDQSKNAQKSGEGEPPTNPDVGAKSQVKDSKPPGKWVKPKDKAVISISPTPSPNQQNVAGVVDNIPDDMSWQQAAPAIVSQLSQDPANAVHALALAQVAASLRDAQQVEGCKTRLAESLCGVAQLLIAQANDLKAHVDPAHSVAEKAAAAQPRKPPGVHLAQAKHSKASSFPALAVSAEAAVTSPPGLAPPLPPFPEGDAVMRMAPLTAQSLAQAQGPHGYFPSVPGVQLPFSPAFPFGWSAPLAPQQQQRMSIQLLGQNATWQAAPLVQAPMPPGVFAPDQPYLDQAYLANAFPTKAPTAIAETPKPQLPSLRHYLEEVSAEDPARILVARRIHNLGFNSQKILREHFSQYGPVLRVLVAHRKIKGIADARGNPKTRPGSLGLIIMKRVASIKKIIALGEEQAVSGHQIRVEMFERSKMTDACREVEQSSTDTSSGLRGTQLSSDKTTGVSSDSDPTTTGQEWSRQTSLETNANSWSRQSSLEAPIPEKKEYIPEIPGF